MGLVLGRVVNKMSEPLPTSVNVLAGTTAVGLSVGSSIGTAESFYRANWEQIVTGNFNVIMADVLGLVSVAVLLINLGLTLFRMWKEKKHSSGKE